MFCKQCKYSAEGELQPDQLKRPLICRRNPPASFPVGSSQGVMVITVWPNVQVTDYCGEWAETPKEDSPH